MYHYIIQTRISYSIGLGLLIFSIVFGWVSFAVPDWLQFYEPNRSQDNTTANTTTIRKFGLWQTCRFSVDSNDFTCTIWKGDSPSFVNVAKVLVPFGLVLGCLSFISTILALICRRNFVIITLVSALLAFLNFVFITIGLCVFATESVVFVNRLQLSGNENPRRWGMWLLIPNLVLACLTSICFIVAALLTWCDYENMQVSGILSHSGDKYNGSVCKGLSESNTTTALKQYYPQQDYPNTCYQLNGANHNNQPNSMGYPTVPPSYGGLVNSAYQPTPPGLFGYSRPVTPPANPMYPHTNFDPYYPRNYMNETIDSDLSPRMSRQRRRSRSRSHRQSEYRSRSVSPVDNTTGDDNNQKQTQFIPIPVPYYQPQPLPTSQPVKAQQSAVPTTNNTTSAPYVIPQTKQYIDENIQPKTTNIFKYTPAQPSVVVSNATPPVYTIAYRANNGGNVLTPNILTGPATATYVTATRNQIEEVTSMTNESDKDEDSKYQTISKLTNSKKFSVNEAWTWHKM